MQPEAPAVDIRPEPARFRAAAGDVVVPVLELAEELARTHAAMAQLGKTTGDYLDVVAEVVERRCAVVLTRPEAAALEQHLFALAALQAQERASLWQRWVQAAVAQAEAFEALAEGKKRLEDALALHDISMTQEALGTQVATVQAALDKLKGLLGGAS
jgi:hypothetical protein